MIQVTITPALLVAGAAFVTALAALVWAFRKDPKNRGR